MVNRKKKGYDPKVSDLRRTLRFAVSKLKPEEIEKVVSRAQKVAKEHYQKLYQGDPTTWKFYFGKEWLSYGLKEILNIRTGRPIDDYRAGMLTLNNLQELAELVGIKRSDLGDVNRSIWWQQIVAWVKENEDSRMNRLKKLWQWFEERLDATDIKYLMDHVPVYWKDKECYLEVKWRAWHLSGIFEITNTILEVVDAKLKSNKMYPATFRLKADHLRVIACEIMNLDLPHNATKEVMWQNILAKIESDNKTKKAQ